MSTLTLINPLRAGVTTGRFGDTYHDANGNPFVHLGWDLAAPVGTPFVAAVEAVVSDLYNDGSLGPYAICLYHEPSRLYILLAHGSKSFVQVGQRVRRGDVIGLVGNLGKSSGPHLHVQVSTSKQFPRDPAQNFDPESFLEEPMTRAERGLINIAWGDFGRALSVYRALRQADIPQNVRDLLPDEGIETALANGEQSDDLNAAMIMRGRLMTLATSDVADFAYQLVGG